MPSVTMSTRVSADERRSKRTCQPTSRPRVQPCSSAIRRATERAAIRRGCSTTTRPVSATAGGTRVVLPVPGGATTTAARCEASAARTSGRLASTGSGTRGTSVSGRRLDPEQGAVGGPAARRLLGGHVEIAVRPLLDVPDAIVERRQEHLPLLVLLRLRHVERDAPQRLAVQRAEERVVLPALELVAGVENETRRADRRHPEHPRVVHARLRPRNRRPGVVATGRGERPAVVVARLEDVDLVAAERPDLGFPELTGHGVVREAVYVAVAEGVDLGQRALASDEGIVGRDAAVVAQAQDLAEVVVERLRPH